MSATQIRGNTQIMAGTIVDAQISATAAIALTKLATVPITPNGATAFTANQSMGSNKLTNLLDPTTSTDAATKNYVDNVAQGLSTKQSVRALAASNITLSGTQTIDGVALSVGDTVLCIAQTTGSQNGSYTVASGAWTRTTDFDDPNDQTRSPYWFVGEGTNYVGTGWVMTTYPYTIGTTSLSFTQFTGAGEIIAGTGLQKSGNTLSIDSTVVTLTGAQTLTNKSIVATQLTGTLQAGQFPALTGDVTTSAGSLATTIAAGVVTLAKMAALAANSVIGNSTGSSATPTAVGMVSTATASTVVFRDANANTQVNSVIENVATIATSGGTTTLTVSSAKTQQFTGTTTQTLVMPNATTLINGQQYFVTNRSTGNVTVNANGGGLLQTMAGGSSCLFTLISNSTAAGTWDVTYAIGAAGAGTVTTVSVVSANGFAGTVANASTTPAITISTTVTGLLKGNGTAISAAVAGTDYMAPSDFVIRETPTGSINGSNTTFTLANTPIANSEHVFLNGLLQEPGAGNDYTISGNTITYLTAPATGDRLRVSYQK